METIRKIIVGVVIIAIFGIFIFIGVLEAKQDKEKYNEGFCSHCNNGHFHLVAVNGKNSKTYYYECDNCYYTIKTSSYFGG